jgi:hypothetical protein
MPPEPIARPNLPTTEEMKKIIFPKIGDPYISETNFFKAHPPILTHSPISNDPLQISTT